MPSVKLRVSEDFTVHIDSDVAKGCEWQLIAVDMYDYYIEFSFMMPSDSETMYTLKGSLVDDRIIGSVYVGNKSDLVRQNHASDVKSDTQFQSQKSSWSEKSKYIGVFQMTK